jgi:GTP cyclohydrolase I
MKAKDLHNIPDVQSAADSRKLAIDQVGVKAIRHPVRVMERPSAERVAPSVQHTIATFNMYVGLPHQFRRRRYRA